jgi:hypothetical protein
MWNELVLEFRECLHNFAADAMLSLAISLRVVVVVRCMYFHPQQYGLSPLNHKNRASSNTQDLVDE